MTDDFRLCVEGKISAEEYVQRLDERARPRWAVVAPEPPHKGFLFNSEEAARQYMVGMRPDLRLERRDPDGTTTRLA